MPASRNRPTIRNKAALQTLSDSIHALEHPVGTIKHPYFDERFTNNSAGVRDMKRTFCEAIILLLETNGHIVAPSSKKPK